MAGMLVQGCDSETAPGVQSDCPANMAEVLLFPDSLTQPAPLTVTAISSPKSPLLLRYRKPGTDVAGRWTQFGQGFTLAESGRYYLEAKYLCDADDTVRADNLYSLTPTDVSITVDPLPGNYRRAVTVRVQARPPGIGLKGVLLDEQGNKIQEFIDAVVIPPNGNLYQVLVTADIWDVPLNSLVAKYRSDPDAAALVSVQPAPGSVDKNLVITLGFDRAMNPQSWTTHPDFFVRWNSPYSVSLYPKHLLPAGIYEMNDTGTARTASNNKSVIDLFGMLPLRWDICACAPPILQLTSTDWETYPLTSLPASFLFESDIALNLSTISLKIVPLLGGETLTFRQDAGASLAGKISATGYAVNMPAYSWQAGGLYQLTLQGSTYNPLDPSGSLTWYFGVKPDSPYAQETTALATTSGYYLLNHPVTRGTVDTGSNIVPLLHLEGNPFVVSGKPESFSQTPTTGSASLFDLAERNVRLAPATMSANQASQISGDISIFPPPGTNQVMDLANAAIRINFGTSITGAGTIDAQFTSGTTVLPATNLWIQGRDLFVAFETKYAPLVNNPLTLKMSASLHYASTTSHTFSWQWQFPVANPAPEINRVYQPSFYFIETTPGNWNLSGGPLYLTGNSSSSTVTAYAEGLTETIAFVSNNQVSWQPPATSIFGVTNPSIYKFHAVLQTNTTLLDDFTFSVPLGYSYQISSAIPVSTTASAWAFALTAPPESTRIFLYATLTQNGIVRATILMPPGSPFLVVPRLGMLSGVPCLIDLYSILTSDNLAIIYTNRQAVFSLP